MENSDVLGSAPASTPVNIPSANVLTLNIATVSDNIEILLSAAYSKSTEQFNWVLVVTYLRDADLFKRNMYEEIFSSSLPQELQDELISIIRKMKIVTNVYGLRGLRPNVIFYGISLDTNSPRRNKELSELIEEVKRLVQIYDVDLIDCYLTRSPVGYELFQDTRSFRSR